MRAFVDWAESVWWSGARRGAQVGGGAHAVAALAMGERAPVEALARPAGAACHLFEVGRYPRTNNSVACPKPIQIHP